ncbi:DedA family protein [Sphingomonas bacterium]|uniref:DedA family protein n=1 Tax=Sphingomonas bacterium TaxID=1895847 RepID=UPI0015758CBB|nr:DedA family protein [Sphingomonas bacterium]
MLDRVLSHVAVFVTAIITTAGYPGLVALMTIAAACVPIPSEIIMPFTGYLVAQGKFSLIGAVLAGTLGENIGAAIAYEAGKRGGRPLIERHGRWLLIDAHHLDLADRFFARFGPVAALIGRVLPIIRAFVAFPAGMTRMNRAAFHLFTTLGSLPWCFALVWLGRTLGSRWNDDPRLHALFRRLEVVIVAAVLVLALAFVVTRVRALRRPRTG